MLVCSGEFGLGVVSYYFFKGVRKLELGRDVGSIFFVLCFYRLFFVSLLLDIKEKFRVGSISRSLF